MFNRVFICAAYNSVNKHLSVFPLSTYFFFVRREIKWNIKFHIIIYDSSNSNSWKTIRSEKMGLVFSFSSTSAVVACVVVIWVQNVNA